MVKAVESVVKNVLEGENQYLVPLYQRPYQWGPDQWKVLWNDLIELANDREEHHQSTHFLGSLVLVPVSESQNAVSISQFLVVDGQQRLTTLTLLLAAIRDFRNDTENPTAGERIQNTYLTNQYEPGNLRIKLVPTQQDRASYAAVIDRSSNKGGDDQIGKAYTYFRAQLEKLDDQDSSVDVAHLEKTALMGLTVVSISTHPDDNVHRIFQSLNNTGLQLTQGDLIRNFIFMRLPTRSEAVYNRYWLPMQRALPTNEALELLFWLDLLVSKPTIKINDTFNEYQKKLTNMVDEIAMEQEVARLSKLANLYALILNPDLEEDPGVRFRLHRLLEWEATTPHVLMLQLLKRREDGQATNAQLERALLMIESYLVRRLLFGFKSQGLNRIFPQLIAQLNTEDPIDDQVLRLLSTGRRHFVSDSELRKVVAEAPYYLNGRRSHRSIFLRWLEESFNSKEPVKLEKLSIEHIMPQTLNSAWREELSEKFGEDQVDEVHKQVVHTLGNLTLTGYNSELGNNSYTQKKQGFLNSGLELNKTLTGFDEWGPEEIQMRAELLSDQIVKTWPGPLSNDNLSDDFSPLWIRVRSIISTIPAGYWATYSDIAAAAGTRPASVRNHLLHKNVLNMHRVLLAKGVIPKDIEAGQNGDDRPIRQILESEGIIFTSSGKASASQQLPLEQLLALVETDNQED